MASRVRISPFLLLLAAFGLGAPAHASDVELPEVAGHPRERFPLALHVAGEADPERTAAVLRAVRDWNELARETLGVDAFAETEGADEAAVLVGFARGAGRLLGRAEVKTGPDGSIELPVRIALFEVGARGETPAETVLYQVAAHELGHALGLRHGTDLESVMCCVRESVDLEDPAVRERYVAARRNPRLDAARSELETLYRAVWEER